MHSVKLEPKKMISAGRLSIPLWDLLQTGAYFKQDKSVVDKMMTYVQMGHAKQARLLGQGVYVRAQSASYGNRGATSAHPNGTDIIFVGYSG